MRIRSNSCPLPRLEPFFEEDRMPRIFIEKVDVMRLKLNYPPIMYQPLQHYRIREIRIDSIREMDVIELALNTLFLPARKRSKKG